MDSALPLSLSAHCDAWLRGCSACSPRNALRCMPALHYRRRWCRWCLRGRWRANRAAFFYTGGGRSCGGVRRTVWPDGTVACLSAFICHLDVTAWHVSGLRGGLRRVQTTGEERLHFILFSPATYLLAKRARTGGRHRCWAGRPSGAFSAALRLSTRHGDRSSAKQAYVYQTRPGRRRAWHLLCLAALLRQRVPPPLLHSGERVAAGRRGRKTATGHYRSARVLTCYLLFPPLKLVRLSGYSFVAALYNANSRALYGHVYCILKA